MTRLPSLILPFLICGCTSSWSQSHNRWQLLQSGTDSKAAWAQCVDRRAEAYLRDQSPAPPPAWYDAKSDWNLRVIFTWVLSDCAGAMTGQDWQTMPPETYQKILGDAYQHLMSSGPIPVSEEHDITEI